MHLLDLPNELLLQVAENLEAPETCSLVRTNRCLATLFRPILSKFALEETYCATVLSLVAADSNEEMIRYLLSEGAPLVIIHPSHGEYDTSSWHSPDETEAVVRGLLDQTSHSMILDKFSAVTPLYMAAELDLQVTTRLLLEKGVDTSFKDFLGQTAFHRAIIKGHENIVSLHLEYGVDTGILCGNGWTALHWAVMKENKNIVKLLLKYDFEVDVPNGRGWTALHWAAKKGPESITRLLLEKGADANAETHLGDTPLSLAAVGNRMEVVRVLLEMKADPNARVGSGGTVLHVLVRHKNDSPACQKLFELLLEGGADPTLKDNWGKGVIELAKEFGMKDITKSLKSAVFSRGEGKFFKIGERMWTRVGERKSRGELSH